MMRMVRGILVLLAILGTAGQGMAQSFHTPGRGSSERTEILDSLRPTIEDEMRGPVEFVVTTIRASRKWAFVQVEPQRPGGRQIDVYRTDFAEGADMMDGLTVYALMQFDGGEWSLVEHVVGPTDVAYLAWPDDYGVPAALLGLD